MNDEKRFFDAPWGTLLKVISTLATLLLLGIFGGMAFYDHVSTTVTKVTYITIPLLIMFTSLLFTVRGYTISGNILRIRRLLWNTNVDISMLSSVEYDPKAMTGSIKTMGNGGLYSFSGKFKSRKLGSFKVYVTDFKNCVIIKIAGETIVVSPGNPELFVEVLRNREVV